MSFGCLHLRSMVSILVTMEAVRCKSRSSRK